MRVAYVCADPGVPVFGRKGASVHVQEVLRVLVAAGARVDLFCARVGGPRPPGLDPVTVHLAVGLPRGPDQGTAARERAALAADAVLAETLRRAGPFDLVYERYSLWSRAGTAHARAAGVPAVVEVNAPLVEEQARHRGLVHRAEAEAVLADVVAAGPALVCVSEPVAAWLRGRGAPAGRVHVVPNGVDTERVRPARREPAGPFTVGFVGTLKPWHGADLLVEALPAVRAAHADARLLVVGDGPGAEPLRRRAGELGLAAAVETTGAVAPDAVPAYLHRMHVAAAPYPVTAERYFCPLKVLEYLAAGLPVVASRTGQLPGLLDGGRAGVLVPPGDLGALAGALAALAGDPARRRRLGSAARERATRRHTWRSVVERSLATTGLALPAGPATPGPADRDRTDRTTPGPADRRTVA